VDKFKDFNFKRTGSAKLDCMYLHLMYEGGDADTRHPDNVKLPFKFSEYKEHLEEINEIIDRYKRLKKVLDCNGGWGEIDYNRAKKKYVVKTRRGNNRQEEEIDDDLQRLIDDVPNDPQTDFDKKCYLSNIKLIGYDQEGNKHEAYV
jgi:hypothetical protein